MGRPPSTEEHVRAKVLVYCERYGVSPGPDGLPPFPSGKRETRQHREWLTVYRALQRMARRAALAPEDPATARCPVCSRALERDLAVPHARHRAGKAARPASLHPACAELARIAETLGPDVVAGLSLYLWPRRRPRTTG